MNKVRRVQPEFKEPEFPQWNKPQTAVGFIVGALLWALMVIAFLFLFYVQITGYYARYLLSFIKPNIVPIPFWLSLIVAVFLPPLAIGIIIIGAVAKLLQD